jgi:hypothetical protein
LWLIERGEKHPRALLWIPPLFLLWLNLHAGFALGPALLLAYGFGLIIETALGNTSWQQARPIVLRVLVLLLVCLALVPLNPSGTQLYRYPFDTLRSPGMRSLIGEWVSPNFHQSLYRPLLLLWLLVLTVFASSRSKPKGRIIVPLLLTSLAALDAVRHIPIFVLLAIPVIVAALPNWSPRPAVSSGPPDSSHFRAVFNGAVLILMAGFALARWGILARNQDIREADLLPKQAIAFLQANHQPPNVFVFYDWGGYTIWTLYPSYRVFVDGRADLYGEDLLRQSIRTVLELRSGWDQILDHWNVETVLVPPSSALAQALLLDRNWSVAFRDSEAIILVRSHPQAENALHLPETHVPGVTKVKKCFPEPSGICETRPIEGLVPSSSPGSGVVGLG